VAPEVGVMNPFGQRVQEVAAGDEEKVSTGHGWQGTVPVAENCPGEQTTASLKVHEGTHQCNWPKTWRLHSTLSIQRDKACRIRSNWMPRKFLPRKARKVRSQVRQTCQGCNCRQLYGHINYFQNNLWIKSCAGREMKST
jgi:hypothetical protein